MAAAAKNGKGPGAGSKAGPKSEPSAPETAEAAHVCDVAFCPIGLALSAVQPLAPRRR